MASRIYTSVVTVGDVNIYQVSADPNGTLEAPQGSLALRNDSPVVYQNTDGGTTWAALGGGGVFEYEEVTLVAGGASADLAAEDTRNIVYTGNSLSFNQPLPTPGPGGRILYRLLSTIIGETTITLTYGGAGGVIGKSTIIGPEDSATIIYGSDADAWYVFPGAVQTP